MPAVSAIDLTGDRYIDGVLGTKQWAVTNLTFSFPAQASAYGAGYGSGEPTNNFGPATSLQKEAVRSVLDYYESITGLRFTEIVERATNHADLRFAQSDKPSTAWAYLPSSGSEGGDVWFNKSGGSYANPVLGNYAYHTILHEIGHALGLEHPHQSGMPLNGDFMEKSVMSYRSYPGGSVAGGYTNDTWSYAQSAMMYDIAALQSMYGANYSTNGGNTTYRWDPSTGEKFVNGHGQGAPGGNTVFETVWDGGGIDTFSFSNYGGDLRIDLRPGLSSLVSSEQLADLGDGRHAAGNVYNALLHDGDVRSLIENAIAGSGDDTLFGNQARNVLTGGLGGDTFSAFGGNDKIVGGLGNDIENGGIGNDLLSGGAGSDVFVFDTALSVSGNVDRVQDFSVVADTIRLDNAVFRGLSMGTLAASAFTSGAAAHDANDRIIYNKATGSLSYDEDGTGADAAIPFAQVARGLNLTSGDFSIV